MDRLTWCSPRENIKTLSVTVKKELAGRFKLDTDLIKIKEVITNKIEILVIILFFSFIHFQQILSNLSLACRCSVELPK